MSRVVFFALGVGLTVVVIVQGRRLLRRATPAGLAEQVQQRTQSFAEQAEEFFTTATEAMRVREQELRTELSLADRGD